MPLCLKYSFRTSHFCCYCIQCKFTFFSILLEIITSLHSWIEDAEGRYMLMSALLLHMYITQLLSIILILQSLSGDNFFRMKPGINLSMLVFSYNQCDNQHVWSYHENYDCVLYVVDSNVLTKDSTSYFYSEVYSSHVSQVFLFLLSSSKCWGSTSVISWLHPWGWMFCANSHSLLLVSMYHSPPFTLESSQVFLAMCMLPVTSVLQI